MTPALSPAPTRAPLPAATPSAPLAQRIDSMDLLRGVAILGIFLMNTWSFSQPQSAYMDPNIYSPDWMMGRGFPEGHENIHGVELFVYSATNILGDMKFITMFSMLFGAGILLQGERAAARGLKPWRIHYGRMGVLMLFGLLHAYALWYGDILTGYACCGVLLYPLRKVSPTLLIVLGVVMVAMVSVINLTLLAEIHVPLLDTLQNFHYAALGHQGGNDYELAVYRGGWWEQIMWHRAAVSFDGQTYGFVTWTLWRCGGCILIGMALHQWKFFHGAWPRAAYATIAALAIPLGWCITALGLVYNVANGWDDSTNIFSIWGFGTEFNYWGSLLTEFGYIAAGVLLALYVAKPAHEFFNKCLWPIRAVGRTALSNYILQSLLATTLFYGHGFGYFGTMSHVDLLFVVGGVWLVQLIISPIYLSLYSQGPLEWLWHRLVYWRGEPPPLSEPAETVSAN